MQQGIDLRQVRRSFDRVAANYSARADVDREIGRRMLERLDYVRIAPRNIIDLGAGTGAAHVALSERYRDADIYAVDLSRRMLTMCARDGSRLRRVLPFVRRPAVQRINAEASSLPMRAAMAQMVWSNLMLHWSDEPQQVFAEVHRVMEVGGLFMFSTLGPDTLRELSAAFGRQPPHVHSFPDMHDLGDWLVHAGFSDPVMDMEMIRLEYASAAALFQDLKGAGATLAATARAKGLQGKASWAEAIQRLEEAKVGGVLPVTLEVVYGHAWKMAPTKVSDGRQVLRFEPRNSR